MKAAGVLPSRFTARTAAPATAAHAATARCTRFQCMNAAPSRQLAPSCLISKQSHVTCRHDTAQAQAPFSYPAFPRANFPGPRWLSRLPGPGPPCGVASTRGQSPRTLDAAVGLASSALAMGLPLPTGPSKGSSRTVWRPMRDTSVVPEPQGQGKVAILVAK